MEFQGYFLIDVCVCVASFPLSAKWKSTLISWTLTEKSTTWWILVSSVDWITLVCWMKSGHNSVEAGSCYYISCSICDPWVFTFMLRTMTSFHLNVPSYNGLWLCGVCGIHYFSFILQSHLRTASLTPHWHPRFPPLLFLDSKWRKRC